MDEMKIIYNKMKKEIYFPIFGIICGELLILSGNIYYGLIIRLITLLFIIIYFISKTLEPETKIILNSFILLNLLQIINLSMPRLFNNDLQQYLLISGVMILPIYLIIRNTGINSRKQLYYIFAALLIGTVTIIFEYRMLTTDILSANGQLAMIVLIILLSMKFVFSDTVYWTNIIETCSNSLIPTFVLIMVYKISVMINLPR